MLTKVSCFPPADRVFRHLQSVAKQQLKDALSTSTELSLRLKAELKKQHVRFAVSPRLFLCSDWNLNAGVLESICELLLRVDLPSAGHSRAHRWQ